MNLDPPKIPNSNPEERVTALILGELTSEEAVAVRQAIEQDAGLARLHERLKRVIGLVREAASNPNDPPGIPQSGLRLSAGRRQKLLAQFKTASLPQSTRLSRREIPWYIHMGIAAALIGLLGVAGLVGGFWFKGISPAKSRTPWKSSAKFVSSAALERRRFSTVPADTDEMRRRGMAAQTPAIPAAPARADGRIEKSPVPQGPGLAPAKPSSPVAGTTISLPHEPGSSERDSAPSVPQAAQSQGTPADMVDGLNAGEPISGGYPSVVTSVPIRPDRNGQMVDKKNADLKPASPPSPATLTPSLDTSGAVNGFSYFSYQPPASAPQGPGLAGGFAAGYGGGAFGGDEYAGRLAAGDKAAPPVQVQSDGVTDRMSPPAFNPS
ncbi:MAG: hypothetical protein M1608_15200, partial [Candidatus Omnitrophica bacterium]|nr:hypothetical protein [Candidatus Omnitrophota bacterium]